MTHSDEMDNPPVPATSLKKSNLLVRMWEAESYSLVLALIIVSSLFEVIAPSNVVTRLVTAVLQGAMLLVALRAARVQYQVLLAAILLFTLAVALSVVVVRSGADRPLVLPRLIGMILLALTPLVIVIRIFRHLIVNVETIFGALSAYLFIGVFFSYAYAVVGSVAQPFFVSPGIYTIKDYLYFSFVTLTTLGFGDLVPKGDLPRMLVVVEAMLGQLYLVTVVALLVSNYTRRQPLNKERAIHGISCWQSVTLKLAALPHQSGGMVTHPDPLCVARRFHFHRRASDFDRRGECGPFVRIDSSLVSDTQVQEQFGGAGGLAHPVVLLLRRNVLAASSVLLWCLVIKLFLSSLLAEGR